MNEEDPLAQLRDIALPDPIGFWPPAPGWWILFILIASLVIWAVIYFRGRWLKTAYRREAIAELAIAWQNFQQNSNTRRYLESISKLVRRCALVAYPNKNIKKLSGRPWLEFLNYTYAQQKPNAFTELTQDFSSLVFQSDEILSRLNSEFIVSLHQLINDWCEHHLTDEQLNALLSKNLSDTTLNNTHQTGASDVTV